MTPKYLLSNYGNKLDIQIRLLPSKKSSHVLHLALGIPFLSLISKEDVEIP